MCARITRYIISIYIISIVGSIHIIGFEIHFIVWTGKFKVALPLVAGGRLTSHLSTVTTQTVALPILQHLLRKPNEIHPAAAHGVSSAGGSSALWAVRTIAAASHLGVVTHHLTALGHEHLTELLQRRVRRHFCIRELMLPEGVKAHSLPVWAVEQAFGKQSLAQTVEDLGARGNGQVGVGNDGCNKRLKVGLEHRWPPRSQLIHDAAQRPQVRGEARHTVGAEELGRHVRGRAAFAPLALLTFWAVVGVGVHGQRKVAELQQTRPVYQYRRRLQIVKDNAIAVQKLEGRQQVEGQSIDRLLGQLEVGL
mmetsp:Transcript_31196/g.50353  ORF Transcript_31196/g.50353 Transcript_31196/m.50353 type:complete len:309 (-) Transcript_31196:422-1348(-)